MCESRKKALKFTLIQLAGHQPLFFLSLSHSQVLPIDCPIVVKLKPYINYETVNCKHKKEIKGKKTLAQVQNRKYYYYAKQNTHKTYSLYIYNLQGEGM